MGMRLRVCRLEEIKDDEITCFAVPGILIPILVTRVNGEIIAGSSMCPHEDLSMESGCIEDNTLICPAHGYAFDLGDGQCTHDPALRWKTYATRQIDGDLHVDLIS